jgi:Rod binding domain-containing protein
VLAAGNRLIYTDTYDEALAQLSTGAQQLVQQARAAALPAGQPGRKRSALSGERTQRSLERNVVVRDALVKILRRP